MKLQLDSPRAELALERLREGEALVVNNIGIRVSSKRNVEVSIISRWSQNAPARELEREAATGMRNYQSLLETWPDLRSIVTEGETVFRLLRDYGNGAVTLGRIDSDGSFHPG